MTLMLDRRSLLLTGTLGLGAMAIPGFAGAQMLGAARGFTHSVASGEPGQDQMLFWTRYVPADGGAADVRVEVAETRDFAKVVTGGVMRTGPWRDHTVKVTVDGLQPGRDYHYRFIAPDGSMSPVGRTKTLPADGAKAWRAAIFSCSNLGFGWFNAYAHAAARNDIDCAIHLGDYFYEYSPGKYPVAKDVIPGRVPVPEPHHEIIVLADYRLRYASYRSDPDLRAIHARLPMIVQWDDHESANDSWEGGAENHDPKTEGDWNPRRAAAIQAYREWMPVSDEPWKAYDIGQLATLFRTETRILARTEQPDIAPLFKNADPVAALKAFRDGPWADPAATMMGSAQEVWLSHAMRASVKSGRPWQVVGFGTIMGQTVMPKDAASWLDASASPRSRGYIESGIAAAQVGLPFNFDNWGGYPAARARFLKSAQALGSSTVVISGDSHNAWAYDLAQDGKPAAVEFAGQSVTSQGYEGGIKTDPKVVAATLVRGNPELKWCDTSRRGYMAMTIAADRVTNDWVMADTVKTRTPRAKVGHSATVLRGRNMMA
ncbi:Alkaline phosphatase D [Sphingomonas sp. EC-HK361]|uniref:alkaline phosphatase D family protein n=1 Tax=Sphingomonas sp. EC-HK361 TaxID=2038397 RepID=UPI0012588DAA|nr:alkaline phosphatase D family protein [Sphingomonas sp. EC-HK361]VVT13867.1 Alkaline phosphatase D [Sphingomonas sp. EC-HK361]